MISVLTQHAEQNAHGQRRAESDPRVELLPGPTIHLDLASPAALAPADDNASALAVKIGLGQRERFPDPQSRALEHHDLAT